MRFRTTLASLGLGTCIGVFVATLCVPLALLFNHLWVRSDKTPLVEELTRSINEEDGILRKSPERFNDCLLPLMALLDDGTVGQLTVSAQRVYSRQRPQQPCRALEQRIVDGQVDDAEFSTVFYHQYWNGHRVVIGALYPTIGVSGYRALLFTSAYGLLGLTIVFALLPVLRRRTGSPGQSSRLERTFFSASVVISSLVLATCFDLQQRATSVASGITNLPVFALWLTATLSNPLTWSPKVRATVAAVLGCWIVYFSVFSGSILFGGLSLMAIAAIAPANVARLREERAGTVLVFASAFCASVAGFLFLHVVVADLVFGENIFAFFFDQLAYRIDGSGRSTMPGALNELYAAHEVSLGRLLERMAPQLSVLGAGSLFLGRSIAIVSLFILGLALPILVLRRRRLLDPWRVIGLALSIVAVPLWYCLFLEHTQVHVGFMSRFLAWPVAGAALVSLLFLPALRCIHWREQIPDPSLTEEGHDTL